MRLQAIRIPDLGTTSDRPIVVSHWFVDPGDDVLEGDRLVELLVGPATWDVTAPIGGRLTEIRIGVDDHGRTGDVLGLLVVPDDEDGPG